MSTLAHYRDGVEDLLAGYTSTRLADVWQAQEFSDWLVQLLHGPADPDDGFQQQRRLARLNTSDDKTRLGSRSQSWPPQVQVVARG